MRNNLPRIAVSTVAIIALLLNWKLRDGKDFTTTDLIFVGIALPPWLGALIESITWGKGNEINFRERFNQVETKADVAIDAGLRGIGKGLLPVPRDAPPEALGKSTALPDIQDPQKGKWGGRASLKGQIICAEVEHIPGEDYFRRLILSVRSTITGKPLIESVRFHLHPII